MGLCPFHRKNKKFSTNAQNCAEYGWIWMSLVVFSRERRNMATEVPLSKAVCVVVAHSHGPKINTFSSYEECENFYNSYSYWTTVLLATKERDTKLGQKWFVRYTHMPLAGIFGHNIRVLNDLIDIVKNEGIEHSGPSFDLGVKKAVLGALSSLKSVFALPSA